MKTDKRLIAFLYRLIRDDIVSGKIEKHLQQLEVHSINKDWEYSNKDLNEYCKKLSIRLLGDKNE